MQYEIYSPYNLNTTLNLSLCDKVKIEINVPVNLNNESISLYQSLSESGYNIFDSGDKFYTDICSTYTTSGGTDMTLEDRKKDIYSTSGNVTLCQSGCNFESYDIETKKAKCQCDIQTNEIEADITEDKFSSKNLADSFKNVITNSNFLVLKCYKLVLELNEFFKNIGRVIMTTILY